MTIQFYKLKGSNFRKVVIFDEDSCTYTAIALIGRSKELVDAGILTPVDQISHAQSKDKWLIVPKQDFPDNVKTVDAELMVFDTLREAKKFILGDF